MSDTKYSEFTLNFNPRFRRTTTKAPMTGAARPEAAADPGRQGQGHRQRRHRDRVRSRGLGAQRGEDRRARLLQRHLESQGSRVARASAQCHDRRPGSQRHRRLRAQAARLLRLFERTEADIQAAKANGESLPRFYGHGLVLLRRARATSISRPGIGRSIGFYSGNAPLHDPVTARAARAAKPAAEPSLMMWRPTRPASQPGGPFVHATPSFRSRQRKVRRAPEERLRRIDQGEGGERALQDWLDRSRLRLPLSRPNPAHYSRCPPRRHQAAGFFGGRGRFRHGRCRCQGEGLHQRLLCARRFRAPAPRWVRERLRYPRLVCLLPAGRARDVLPVSEPRPDGAGSRCILPTNRSSARWPSDVR